MSVIGFVLIVWGFAEARYTRPRSGRRRQGRGTSTILLMLVSMLLLAGYLFKQSHITVAVHHPMVWSVAVFGFGASHRQRLGGGRRCCSARFSSGRWPTS